MDIQSGCERVEEALQKLNEIEEFKKWKGFEKSKELKFCKDGSS